MPAHILVVDDEPDLELLIRQKFRREIRAGTHRFAFARDGVEALEVIEREPAIDVVMTDITMPRMDGLTLLGRVRELQRMVKVLVVSAYSDLRNIRSAMNQGAFDFIVKPIDFDDLHATLERAQAELEAHREGRASREQLASLQRELDIASTIQLSALPNAFPDHPDVRIQASMLPALEVGGDFYDFFLIDAERVGFAVGDVAGKGIGAALFMAVTRTLLRSTALQGLEPGACVRHVNRILHPESIPQMFVTLVYGTIELRTGRVIYCNAGHNGPYVLRAGGAVESLPRARNVGLCLVADFAYSEGEVTLAHGDGLLLYTDGVTEATRDDREQFGEARLERALGGLAEPDPTAALAAVHEAVRAFADGAKQADDLTVLALQRLDGDA